MCFTEYIAVKSDCGGDTFTPESGLYVNDLEGINLNMAGDIADADYVNGLALLQAKRDFAIERVKSKAAMLMGRYMRLTPLLDASHAGEFAVTGVDADDYLAIAAGVWRGVEICIDENQSHNAYRINVRNVQILANTTAAAQTVRFTDYVGNVVLSLPVNLTAGEVATLEVNQTFVSPVIWVNMEGDVAVNDSALHVHACRGCGGVSKGSKNFPYAYVRGLHQDGTRSQDTFGLSVQFSIECSIEEVLCRLKYTDTLKFLMLYSAGIEIANEAIYTDRFNALPNLRGNDFENLRDKWEEETKELWDSFADNIAPAIARYAGDCATCKRTRAISGRL